MIIPLFGMDSSGGSPSKSLNVDAQDRLNLYVEPRLDTDKTRMALYQTPGNQTLLGLGAFPTRGAYVVREFLYIVQRFSLLRIDSSNVVTIVGTLVSESGFVSMSDNGLQLFMVDGDRGYCYVFATGEFATLEGGAITSAGAHNGLTTAAGFPAVASTVTFQGSYFIIGSANAKFFISGQLDGFTWKALDFATAETNPDDLVTVLSDHGELVLFGTATTEFWGNVGALSFPFALIQGSALEWGLAAREAWAKFDNSIIFLGRNRQGRVQVMQVSGHNVVRVSTHELEAKFEDYTAVSDATAFSYMLDGHPMFQLNFSTGLESWLYDGAASALLGMPIWSRLTSADLGRHRIDRVVAYDNRLIGTDYVNGNVYTISHTDLLDNGEPITSRLRTRHYFEDDEMVNVAQVWLDVETGVGTDTGQGSDPQVVFRYSKNGGHTWSRELWRSMGKAGEYRKRCYWNRLGAARDWVYEWTITDPVKRALLNAGLKTLSRKQRRAT